MALALGRWTMVGDDLWCMMTFGRSSISRLNRGPISRCWWMVGCWLRVVRGWVVGCWLRVVYFLVLALATFTFATEPAALLCFLLLFIVRMYPDLLIGDLGDLNLPPFLNMCHHGLLDEFGWWWLQNFLVGGIWLLDSDRPVNSDRPFDLHLTIVCDRLVGVTWGSEVDMTVVITSFA